jgi:putative serine protease PepD
MFACFRPLCLTLCLCLLWPAGASAQQPGATPSAPPADQAVEAAPARPAPLTSEQVAQQLIDATVTVRMVPRLPALPSDSAQQRAAPNIKVFSGVSLGDGLVVTFNELLCDGEFRIALSDGQQFDARLRGIDFYSGLCLLEVDNRRLPGLELAEVSCAAGAPLYSAAASGIDKPVVSRGILGGSDQTLTGSGLPPLLQCDVRTTDTSSGAAVVDQWGRLQGIVAVSASKDPHRWTFAVPAGHVQRLLRACAAAPLDDSVVVLRRQRPTAGVIFQAGPQRGQVLVERVTPGGPADQAGLQRGDEVLACDGVLVHSVDEIIARALKKQPGDSMELVVVQGGETRTLQIILAGGQIVSRTAPIVGPGTHPNQLAIRQEGDRVIIRPLSLRDDVPAAGLSEEHLRLVELLAEQANRFGAVIKTLQGKVQELQSQAQRDAQQIEALREENARLRRQLEQLGVTP